MTNDNPQYGLLHDSSIDNVWLAHENATNVWLAHENATLREQLAAANDQIAALTRAGRHVLAALGGAADNTPGERWSRKNVFNLHQHLRKEYPEFDASLPTAEQ